jgi:hypothetical protein
MDQAEREDTRSAHEAVPWTVTAFQRSRQETWKAIRAWLIVLASAGIGFATPFWIKREHVHSADTWSGTRYALSAQDETAGEFTLSVASFVLGGAAVIGIVVGVRRHYRCPKCEAVPMAIWAQLGPGSFGSRRDLDVNPSACTNCGARLR